MTLVLRTEGLGKRFTLHLQGGLQLPVLAGIDVDLHAGECVALTGASGAGKSTLLRSLYGNYRADAGRIWLRHRGAMVDLAAAPPRAVLEMRAESIGHVTQFLRVVPRVPALDLVAEVLTARGTPTTEARARAAALLHRLNIPTRLHALPPANFSGGEQQRVNLARGFAGGHPVLLLDEPTSALDTANRDAVIALVQQAKARGTAFVGIYHDAAMRAAVADRLFEVPRMQDAAHQETCD